MDPRTRTRTRTRTATLATGALATGALATALAAAGCDLGAGTEVDDVLRAGGRRYALASIAGQPLPAPYAENPAVEDRVIAGELALADGRGAWSLTVVDARSGRMRRSAEAFTYATVGGRVRVEFPCDDTASCIGPPHLQGVVTAERVVFDSSRVTRAPLVFERVP
jgi:hypothetical protein